MTVNSIGLRDLGVGGLIGVSGLTTAVVGFLATLLSDRPEYTGKALLCALVSGVLGAFILGSIQRFSKRMSHAAAGGLRLEVSGFSKPQYLIPDAFIHL